MALPVRPSSSALDFPLNTPPAIAASDASNANISSAAPQQADEARPATQDRSKLPATHSPKTPLSSPLSSQISIPSPGAPQPKMASSDSSQTSNSGGKSASPTNGNKVATAPTSPISTKSATSEVSKKRVREDCHDEPAKPAKKPAKRTRARAPQAPPTVTRPSRTRKAPERFEVTPPKKAAPTPARKPGGKVFNPIYITTNSTSRLGKADVYHMLLTDGAWTNLSKGQKQTLLSMLPSTPPIKRLQADIASGAADPKARPREFGPNFVHFRTDVAKFLEDLTNGHLAKGWQASAEQAVLERAAGRFDAWKAAEAEAWWGQK